MPVARRKISAGLDPLATRTFELAFAVPQVMGFRLWRMALAGPQPSARDRAEFHRMGVEKLEAFAESWQAMGWKMLGVQQELMLGMLRLWMPWWHLPHLAAGDHFQRAASEVLNAGLAPVHRRATANARRLARR